MQQGEGAARGAGSRDVSDFFIRRDSEDLYWSQVVIHDKGALLASSVCINQSRDHDSRTGPGTHTIEEGPEPLVDPD